MAALPLASLKIVRPKRLYEQIAEQIEALIRSESLEPGTRLPSERELAERLGVSRPSIREALIALETAGFLEVRAGGGTFTRTPGHSVSFALAKNKDLGPGTLEQFEARKAIETACAELAAKHASEDQLDAIEACFRRMKALMRAGRSPAVEHKQFHALLAEASGNSILASVVRELWRMRDGEMWDTLRKRVENLESWKLGLVFRRVLIDCLRQQDGAGARAAAEKHFARLQRLYFDGTE